MKPFIFLKLIRINQWVKNGFVFMPLVFSGRLLNTYDFALALFAFIVFCLLSSSVYILNDLKDMDIDKLHPRKKNRPLANGVVSAVHAKLLLAILLFVTLLLSYKAGRSFFLIALFYLIIHIAYNAFLKKVVILDAISIAIGFELRIWAGAVVLSIFPSTWIQLCVFFLTLLISFVKRKGEKQLLDNKAAEHRSVLFYYSSFLLSQMITISAILCIVTYGFYVFRAHSYMMLYTIPFVVYGIFRYIYLVDARKTEGDPEEILTSDAAFVINLVSWFCFIIFVLYHLK